MFLFLTSTCISQNIRPVKFTRAPAFHLPRTQRHMPRENEFSFCFSLNRRRFIFPAQDPSILGLLNTQVKGAAER
jgi:hypothetical protein